MAVLARLLSCALFVAANASGVSLLMKSASRSRVRMFAGLRYAREDPAAKTLLTLDTNHDGRIDPAEIASFARAQGMDPSAATEEFSSIDSNKDGVLDSMELQQVLGVPTQGQAALAEAAVKREQSIAPVTSVEEPVAVSSNVQAAPASIAAIADAKKDAVVETGFSTEAAPVADSSVLISEESRQSMQDAAKKLAEQLEIEESEERASRDLQRKASEANSQAAALEKQTMQVALDAGVAAAHAKAKELVDKISQLEDQAQTAEVKAAALHAKSKAETEQANSLMAIADQALK